MTDGELKGIVREYILEGLQSDAGDSLYEMEDFEQLDEDEVDGVLDRAYALYNSAIVTVAWEGDE